MRRKRIRRTKAKTPDPAMVIDHEGKVYENLHCLIAAGLRFRTIVADPPWAYLGKTGKCAAEEHYPTMSLSEIAAIPVAQLADERCHIHLWTTNAMLQDALLLLRIWGFTLKSTFVWVKSQLGIGRYWRCSHELMLLGVKGRLTFPPTNIKSWIEAPRTRHSEKPEAVLRLIERVSPGPRIELFARKQFPGWTVFGNQIEETLLL